MAKKGILKTCKRGHQYYKSSDCPTCPICGGERKPIDGFLSLLSAPARRALENAGIKSLRQLAKYRKSEILELHGMGPSSIPTLVKVLEKESLNFRDD